MTPAPASNLPFDIVDVTAEEDKVIKKVLLGYRSKFVKCGKQGYVMPGSFRNHAEEIYNFKVRPDDVWVITFPRSGTTWSQEMIWLLKNDLDYKTAKDKPLYQRFPMLETTTQIPDVAFDLIKMNFMNLFHFQGLGDAARRPSWKALEEAPSPRFIKTHLPLSLLPPDLLTTAKVVYVGRDPRDVAVSYYYLHKMFQKSLLKFNNFWEAFRRDLLPWTPIIAHTNEAWKQRRNPNLHFVFYEDMLKDLPKEIKRLCGFLERKYTNEEINTLAKHLSFDSIKKNKTVNDSFDNNGVQFVRKGEAGGWRSKFTPKMEAEAEEFLSTRLNGLDIEYPSMSTIEITHL